MAGRPLVGWATQQRFGRGGLVVIVPLDAGETGGLTTASPGKTDVVLVSAAAASLMAMVLGANHGGRPQR